MKEKPTVDLIHNEDYLVFCNGAYICYWSFNDHCFIECGDIDHEISIQDPDFEQAVPLIAAKQAVAFYYTLKQIAQLGDYRYVPGNALQMSGLAKEAIRKIEI